MVQPPKIDTRDRLLQAAASLMWERSFQTAGVDELCERAAVTKGSFYHFFPAKSDLAIAAIEHSWETAKTVFFEPIFSVGTAGLEQIQRLVQQIYAYQTQTALEEGAWLGCPFGNLGQEMARQDERIRATVQIIFDAHCRYLEKAIALAEKKGEIPPGNTQRRARNVFALLEGALLLAKVENDPNIFRNVTPALLAVAAS